ncbi:nucleotidyltransferase domain-containing protein [Treponema succinifaciens]|uniref:nucleotidyltransferase domain-containing protein n=1 Tax=Treponema succinifaciens TaxID=167 RepID=UPI0023F1ECF3|nr:nucleotidyltransferase domain-containing protein [Treponema succinifaciens]
MKEKNITKEIQQELEEITKSILSVVSVKEIFLFGSYANGTPSENSDFDIYVVIPDNSMRPLDAMTKINMAISKNQKRPVDILVGSQSDFKKRSSLPYIEKEVFNKGIKIYA